MNDPKDSQVSRDLEVASVKSASQASQQFSRTHSRERSQQSLASIHSRSSAASINSQDTDLAEGHRLDQLVVSYGLDRLVDDEFLDIFLQLHSLCTKTGLSVSFIDLQDVEGRARWLLGIVQFFGIDREGDKYEARDFYIAFDRIRAEKQQQEELEKEVEIQRRLEEEKNKWDEDHREMVMGMLHDASKDNKRSMLIKEERDGYQALAAELEGDIELQLQQSGMKQPLLKKEGEQKRMPQDKNRFPSFVSAVSSRLNCWLLLSAAACHLAFSSCRINCISCCLTKSICCSFSSSTLLKPLTKSFTV